MGVGSHGVHGGLFCSQSKPGHLAGLCGLISPRVSLSLPCGSRPGAQSPSPGGP